jgi:hypothetical protein
VPSVSAENEAGVVAVAGEADKKAEDQDVAADAAAAFLNLLEAAPPRKLEELPPLVAATHGEGSTAAAAEVVAVAEQPTWHLLVMSLVGFLLAAVSAAVLGDADLLRLLFIFLKRCCPWDVQLGCGWGALNIPTPVRQGTPAGTAPTPPTKPRAARHEAESEVEHTRVGLPLRLAPLCFACGRRDYSRETSTPMIRKAGSHS